ncbi:MAG TPA: Fic family protein [bacterium]|nr:Fic family protein [bacterium]
MDAALFRKSPAGTLALTEQSQFAFVPNPLPPLGIRYESVMYRLSNASTLLGHLAGAGRVFPNPYLLARPLQRKEAVASSSIEGTHTTLSDLFLFEARDDDSDSPPDTREVRNYVRALENAIESLDSIPISTRMILKIHEDLLHGLRRDRGGEVAPGHYKRHQNYIGGSSLAAARFIPSPPAEVSRLMGDLENFINSVDNLGLPPLIHAALMHYQFEAIHPFADGNGRVGRVLIPLMLKQMNAMQVPLLYLSPYIEERKDEYIETLFNVSARGAWLEWIDFFLHAVEVTCERTISKIYSLHNLNQSYLETIQKARNSALLRGLVNSCFSTPFTTIPLAQITLGVTYRAAKNNIDKLVEAGILTELADGKRPRLFYAQKVYNIVNQV